MKLYTVYEFMKKVGITDTSLIADMETKGFLIPANQTMAGTRYYSKQQIKNFDYLYSLYVDFCRKEMHKKIKEADNIEPSVTIVGNNVLPELKPLMEDINYTKTDKELTYTDKIVPPSCTSKGYTEHICNENKFKTYKDNEVPALGHDYIKEIISATCIDAGKEIFNCSRCGHSYTNEIPAAGHNFKRIKYKEATCTDFGFELLKCDNCNEKEKHQFNALGHDFTYETINEGTCTEDKVVIETCSRCKISNKKVTVAPGHNFIDEIIAPDCINEGYTKRVCSVCNIEEKINIVPALGHQFTEMIEYEPTEYRDGEKTLTCSVCNYKVTEKIPKLQNVASTEDLLKHIQKMQEETNATLQESLEEAKKREEQINSYTGPMTVTGRKRF